LTEHPKATAINWTANGQSQANGTEEGPRQVNGAVEGPRQANGTKEGPIFIHKKAEELEKLKGERELHKVKIQPLKILLYVRTGFTHRRYGARSCPST
jgi:hypothetical protein